MWKLLTYLKNYKKESVLGPLFKLLEASFELFVPLVMASIIDKGIARQDTPHVLWMGALLVLLGVVGLHHHLRPSILRQKRQSDFRPN